MEDGRAFSHVNIRGDRTKKSTKDEEDSAKDGGRRGKRWDCWGKEEEGCCQCKDDMGYSFHGSMLVRIRYIRMGNSDNT